MGLRLVFFYVVICFALAGCEERVSLEKACDANPSLCSNLGADTRCSSLRRDVIVTDFDLNKSNHADPELVFEQLQNLEKYVACSELSTKIEHNKRASLFVVNEVSAASAEQTTAENFQSHDSIGIKQKRQRTYHAASELFNRLQERSSISESPHLLYWHWSRNGSQTAIDKLIQMDEKGQLNQYDLSYFISQEYIRYDYEKAKGALYRSLENYPSEKYKTDTLGALFSQGTNDESIRGQYHRDIFRGLTTMYFQEKKYENAYVFASLLKLNRDDSVGEASPLHMFLSHNDVNLQELESIAATMHEMLEQARFDPSILPETI